MTECYTITAILGFQAGKGVLESIPVQKDNADLRDVRKKIKGHDTAACITFSGVLQHFIMWANVAQEIDLSMNLKCKPVI